MRRGVCAVYTCSRLGGGGCGALARRRQASTPSTDNSNSDNNNNNNNNKTSHWWERLVPRLAGQTPPRSRTRADVYAHPRGGYGYDAVASAAHAERVSSTLQYKRVVDVADYLDVDEVDKWLDATHAAAVLGIAADELPRLTRATLEERWHAAYRARAHVHAKASEVVLAAEVLLEYLDSSTHVKKSRRYYREQLHAARVALDAERHAHRRAYVFVAYQVTAVGMLFICVLILVTTVMHWRQARQRERAAGVDDDDEGGSSKRDRGTLKASLQHVMGMWTGIDATVTTPPPDYSTRYFATPTSREQARRERCRRRHDGNADNDDDEEAAMLLADEHTATLMRDAAAYDERDAMATLQLWNDEKARAAREAAAAAQRASRVAVHYDASSHSADDDDNNNNNNNNSKATSRVDTAMRSMTLAQRFALMQRTLGGNSVLARVLTDTDNDDDDASSSDTHTTATRSHAADARATRVV